MVKSKCLYTFHLYLFIIRLDFEMLCFFVSRSGELTVLLPCIKHAVIGLCGLYDPLLERGKGGYG